MSAICDSEFQMQSIKLLYVKCTILVFELAKAADRMPSWVEFDRLILDCLRLFSSLKWLDTLNDFSQ
jgi:hypothetical protein